MTTTQLRREATPDEEPAQRHTASSTAPWLLVASREIYVRATNRTFLVSTLLTVLFIAGFAAFQVVRGNQTTQHTIAVTDPAASALVGATNTAMQVIDDKVSVTAGSVPDEAAARTALLSGEATAWLHRGSDGWQLTSMEEVDSRLVAALQDTVRTRALEANAVAAGTTATALLQGSTLRTDRLDGQLDDGAVKGATFAFALLFYFAAMMFGLQIAGSVVEEKQSRIVEIIATAIPLRHLLAGKVLGNSAIALAQVILYSAVGLVAVSFTDISALLPSLASAIGWFVAFFAVGFLALACLYAVAGALASRNEDLQSTTAPMTMVLMVVYFASFGLSGTAERVASYVPITSVIAMPARILSSEAAWWEPLLALLIMGGFAAGAVIVGERVYRRSLLQTRGKLSWRQALSGAE